MGNILLQNIAKSTYGDTVTVDIIDLEYDGEPIVHDIETPFVTVELNGNKSDPFDPIKTISISGNIILDENTEFIFNDVFNAQEGRFFVQVSIDNNDGTAYFYTAKIVADGFELDDRVRPTFFYKAIDGITDLKGKTWNRPEANLTVARVISHCLNQLDIVQLIAAPELIFQSEIEPNIAAYTNGRLADCTLVNDYFYRSENEEQKPFNCYEVLVEILTRLNLQLIGWADKFYVIGNETLFGTRTKNASKYNLSNGNYISSYNLSTDPIFTTAIIDDTALAGGRYFFKSGFNKVTIEADPKFSNRKVGDTTLNKLVYPAITSVAYKRMPGAIKPNKEYSMLITCDVVSLTKATTAPTTPGFFTLRQSVREENVTTSAQTVLVTDYNMTIPTQVGKIIDEIIITEEDYFRYMDVTTSLVGLSGTNIQSMVVNVSYLFRERKNDYDTIKVISEIPTSKFVNQKVINIYGNHEKGNDLVQFYFFSQSFGTGFTNQFRIGTGAWKALEALIAEDQLLRMGNMVELNIGYNDYFNTPLFVGGTITYKSDNYKIVGMSQNVHENIYQLELIRQANNTGTIVTTYEVPTNSSNLNTSDYGTVSSMNSNIDRYYAQFYKEVTVDGEYYEEDLDRFFNGTIQENKTYFNLYVNGSKYIYIDPTTVSNPPTAGELDIQHFTYIKSSNRIYFGYDLDNSLVILHFIGIAKPDATA